MPSDIHWGRTQGGERHRRGHQVQDAAGGVGAPHVHGAGRVGQPIRRRRLLLYAAACRKTQASLIWYMFSHSSGCSCWPDVITKPAFATGAQVRCKLQAVATEIPEKLGTELPDLQQSAMARTWGAGWRVPRQAAEARGGGATGALDGLLPLHLPLRRRHLRLERLHVAVALVTSGTSHVILLRALRS